jgi:hypothetical protein
MYSSLWINKRAFDHYERAVSICGEVKDTLLELMCIREMGILNYRRGDAPGEGLGFRVCSTSSGFRV